MLCGVRDLRDYRIHARSEPAPITGGSAFNIKAKSLRLGDSPLKKRETLAAEHTQETGQTFTAEALERVWALTQGQPWLVNALAYRTCFELPRAATAAIPSYRAMIDAAKESLIFARVTHLDQLADKLREERVRRIIEPMLAGTALGAVPWMIVNTWSISACCAAPMAAGWKWPTHLSRGAAAHAWLAVLRIPCRRSPHLAQCRRQL